MRTVPVENPPELLLVDADPDSRASIAALLRGSGYPVVQAHNGIEGLRLLGVRMPALLILDPWPFVSAALQMAAHMREVHPGTPVLVLGTAAPHRARARARLPGTTECLDKTCAPADLLSAVERLLRGATLQSDGLCLDPPVSG